MQKHKLIVALLFLNTAAAVVMSSCATPPQPKPLSREERIEQDSSVGKKIAPSFETELSFKHDADVTSFLRRVAKVITERTPELQGVPTQVLLIEDVHGKWSSFALPGNRLYLSVSLLRGLDFENEAAAQIAFQLGHIAKRQLLNHYEQFTRRNPNTAAPFFGEEGLFSYTDEEMKETARTAVELLYRAGYDPRGLVTMWLRFEAGAQHAPFSKGLLSELLNISRSEIARYAPLRNPVVRSQAFIQIQSRIKKL